jgi:hypothetical protein
MPSPPIGADCRSFGGPRQRLRQWIERPTIVGHVGMQRIRVPPQRDVHVVRRVRLEGIGDDIADRLLQAEMQGMRRVRRQPKPSDDAVDPCDHPRKLRAVVPQREGVHLAYLGRRPVHAWTDTAICTPRLLCHARIIASGYMPGSLGLCNMATLWHQSRVFAAGVPA